MNLAISPVSFCFWIKRHIGMVGHFGLKIETWWENYNLKSVNSTERLFSGSGTCFSYSCNTLLWRIMKAFLTHTTSPCPLKSKFTIGVWWPLLQYGSETCTLHQHEIRQLHPIQQRHLHLIMNIKWDQFVNNEVVLVHAGVEDIELRLVGSRLLWLSHVCRLLWSAFIL